MEATSPLVSLNGRNGPKDLGEYRKRAIENAMRHQFYQSDRVKQFHRGLLLMETLNDRRLQVERNRRIKDDTDEETRKFMAEIRRGELEALEQEHQRASRRQTDARAYAEGIRQQMTEMAQARQRMKQDKQLELHESQALREQYKRDKLEVLRLQRERKLGVRSAYLAQMAQSRSQRDEENRSEALAEERRRRWVREKDEWNRANEQKMADRLRRLQRRSQAAADALAAQERERTRTLEAAEASAHARALASQEAQAQREQSRREQTRLDVARGISAQREYMRREGQLRAEEERRSSLHLLSFNKEADRAHWEAEKRADRAQRDARVVMDAALRQQMADKRLQEELRKQAEMDADARKLELLESEDVQFQRYATAVIQAAHACKRNTVPIRKAANAGARQGAKYLVPGSNYIPDYANSTTKDINRSLKKFRNERDKLELLRLQQERKLAVRSTYLAQMAQSRSQHDEENQSKALAEERRRRCVREKDEWNRANEQKMADKRLQEELRKQAEMDADARKLELLEREDVQFRRYAAAVIQAAQACKRNTVPICKAANAGARQGVGPIYRGLRAKYLVPGSNYIPDYANSMTKDINRLFNTTADESSHGKLSFIW